MGFRNTRHSRFYFNGVYSRCVPSEVRLFLPTAPYEHSMVIFRAICMARTFDDCDIKRVPAPNSEFTLRRRPHLTLVVVERNRFYKLLGAAVKVSGWRDDN